MIARVLPPLLLALALLWPASAGAEAGADPCPAGATLSVVAHEDDDLLFLSPDLLYDVWVGRCLRTVFATAGDDGRGAAYWHEREAGSEAAYAAMDGVPDTWRSGTIVAGGHPVLVRTLTADPRISLVFLRLPDGHPDGAGFAVTHRQSLMRLRDHEIPAITALDGSAIYTKAGLAGTMAGLMAGFRPDTIRTQDQQGTFGDGDHADHHAAAYLAQDAARADPAPHVVVGYLGYRILHQARNVFGVEWDAKLAAFLAYGAHDDLACATEAECAADPYYSRWPERQYRTDDQGDPPGWDPPCVVPGVVGARWTAARARMAVANCRLGAIRRRRSATVPRGRVIATSPPPSRRSHAPGARVTVTLSRGR